MGFVLSHLTADYSRFYNKKTVDFERNEKSPAHSHKTVVAGSENKGTIITGYSGKILKYESDPEIGRETRNNF